MNVLSLFDGMSCGQIALDLLNVKVNTYFASEIKKHAILVTNTNYPKTVQLGDVRNINSENLPNIDLLIGGSPCQDFSIANKDRKGLKGEKSSLFWEYYRLLKEIKPKYFLLENVIMDKENYKRLSDIMECEPVRINASRISAVHRDRYYWTNIGGFTYDLFGNKKSAIKQPQKNDIKLNDVLTSGFSEKDKHTSLNTRTGRNRSKEGMIRRYNTTGMVTLIFEDEKCDINGNLRLINQHEMEILHGIPNGYTSCVNKDKAGDLIGDGWHIDVIKYIFSHLPKTFFK